MTLTYTKPKRLKTHPQFNEKWVQQRIAEDPSILGLGDLVLKDEERRHPNPHFSLTGSNETADFRVSCVEIGIHDLHGGRSRHDRV